MIAKEVRLFLVALQFLTRIPVPSFAGFEVEWLDRSAKYFPAIGLIVGGVSAAVLLMAANLWPQPIPALLAVCAAIAVTGAFHEDGLADTADGLGGGLTKERRLEIMKDSRIGTYGAIVLVASFALRVAALASVPVMLGAAALVSAHAVARIAPVLMIRFARYAGDAEAAKVKPLATGLTNSELAVAVGIGFGAAVILLGWPMASLATFAAALAAGVVALQAWRLIGGYTGDNLGAMEQGGEVAFLLAVATLGRP